MVWDSDYDVKEYHPKKKNKVFVPFPKNAAATEMAGAKLRRDGVLDGGAVMTTSEILDFSEGADSYS